MTNLVIPPRLQETFDLVIDEVAECIAAEQILNGFIRHHEDIAGLNPAIHRPWYFIEQAVSWKFALAVNRLLQPAHVDRASLLGIEREVTAAKGVGFILAFPERNDRALVEMRLIRETSQASALRSARDAFMAHALVGGSRVDVPMEDVRNLLERIEPVVEEIHIALSGSESPLQDRYLNWLDWSDSWWDQIFPWH